MSLRRVLVRSWQGLFREGSRLTSTFSTVDRVNYPLNEAAAIREREISLLEERSDLDTIDTPSLNLKPSFNLAAYVNKSDTLQQLIKLGVNLHRLEKKPDLAQFVLGLNFEEQVQPHLLFLHDIGIAAEDMGAYLTKNPAILKENLDDLRVRITYLKSKRFKQKQIERIVQKNPYWLMFSTPKIDDRLGFFQRQLSLSGAETRQLAIAQPRIITYSIEHIRQASFTVLEEMGMTKAETKELVLKLPKVLTMGKMGLSPDITSANLMCHLLLPVQIPSRQWRNSTSCIIR